MMNFDTSQAFPPEQLLLLGKTAAHVAETSGMALTDAVVRSVGMTKLNEQQVRRVVEAANHEAFHRKFASMDPTMRVVELDGGPADPNAVIERLALAAMPAKVAAASSDYRIGPKYAHAFTSAVAGEMTKEAAMQPVLKLASQLRASHDELSGNLAARQAYVETAVQKLAYATKQAVSMGAYYEDLEPCWGAINPKLATEMLSVLNPPSVPPGVKLAGRRISDDSDVLTAFAAFSKVASEYEVACEAVHAIEQELVKVDYFLRGA